jgi:hypothetical protein
MRLMMLLPLLAAVYMMTPAAAQPIKPSIISGTVKDAGTKSPLNEAVVTLSSSTLQGQKLALTDSTGTYSVRNLPAGKYTISFEMEGYEKSIYENIVLQEGMSLGVSFQMVKERKVKRPKQEDQKVIAIKKEEN